MDKTIAIDDDLVKAAQDLTGVPDEREAVEHVVREYIREKRAKSPLEGMLDLVGKVRLRDDYDYKKLRADDHDPV